MTTTSSPQLGPVESAQPNIGPSWLESCERQIMFELFGRYTTKSSRPSPSRSPFSVTPVKGLTPPWLYVQAPPAISDCGSQMRTAPAVLGGHETKKSRPIAFTSPAWTSLTL